jgi:hypothetical protein
MDRERVRSSNIKSVGYDPGDMTLEIEFHDGGIYRYFNVPADVHEGLMRASSKGAYFHDHIKERYRFRKVR